MSFKVAKLALAVAALSAAAATQAGTFTGTGQRLDKSLPKQSYNASQVRPYEIYIPKSYVAGTPMPMRGTRPAGSPTLSRIGASLAAEAPASSLPAIATRTA